MISRLMLGRAVIRWGWADGAHWLRTEFPDDTYVPAAPNFTPEAYATALDLGYGDNTWAMSRDHEITHTWLATRRGEPWSPTLWRLAHPDDPANISDVEVGAEEDAVLDFQRRLDKSADRPGDALIAEHAGSEPDDRSLAADADRG